MFCQTLLSPIPAGIQDDGRSKSKSRAESQARGSHTGPPLEGPTYALGLRKSASTVEINMTRRLFSALLITLPLWASLSPARATTVAPPPNLGALARASQAV